MIKQPLRKIAENDEDFESSVFQLAFGQLQSKIPSMVKNLVGFEIKDKDEKLSKAYGLFGFRSDSGHVCYIPVFFSNGAILGLDELYSKNNEQFYPLNEDFAEMLMTDSSESVGSPSAESYQQLQRQTTPVDFRDLVRPPQLGRISYAAEGKDLMSYIKEAGGNTKQAFMGLLETYPDYLESVMRFYSMEKIAEALADDKEIVVAKEPYARYVKPEDVDAAKDLPVDKKRDLLTKGYVLIDKRPEDAKSKYGPVKFEEKFTTPQVSGLYPYVTKPGTIHYGFIIVKPHQFQQYFSTDDSIIIDLDEENEGQAYLADTKDIFVKDQIMVGDYSDIFKRFENLADASPSFESTYVLTNEKFYTSVPFKILASFKDAAGVRRIQIETVSEYFDDNHEDRRYGINEDKNPRDLPGSIHDKHRGNFYDPPIKKRIYTLVVTKKPGDKFHLNDEYIYVPADFKLLKVKLSKPHRPYWGTHGLEISEDERSHREAQQKKYQTWLSGCPGHKSNITGALADRNVFPLTVNSNGSEFFASINDFKKRYSSSLEAKLGMILDFGLHEKTAESLIDSLVPSFAKKGWVKMADLGSYSPTFTEEQPYMDEFGQPTWNGEGYVTPQPIDHTYTEDPSRIGLGTKPDVDGIPNEVNKAVQLAQGGQKEIFDAQSINTLARYVSPSDKVQEYTPYFLTALDRLGRLLFLLHWDADKFKEMYGRTDLPRLMELLTSVFKNFGDLIIFLKRKSPELSINMGPQDVLNS